MGCPEGFDSKGDVCVWVSDLVTFVQNYVGPLGLCQQSSMDASLLIGRDDNSPVGYHIVHQRLRFLGICSRRVH